MSMIINGKTGLTGLLGSPVGHSKSPMMHNTSFQELGINYVYLCFDVGIEGLSGAVDGLVSLGAKGWNCTMPNKSKMAQLCDVLSPAASITGSVNTVVNENGKLMGYNTDGTGYMRAVKEAGFSIKGEKMTLLGAGGAATSILVQAALDGVREISVFCRPGKSTEHARQVINKLTKQTACQINLFDYSDVSEEPERNRIYLAQLGDSAFDTFYDSGNWVKFSRGVNMQRWAYVEDLLPNKQEEQQ